jgi:hypothetical protein
VRVVGAVVEAIGTAGMIGGQVEDLEAEKDGPEAERFATRLERSTRTRRGV